MLFDRDEDGVLSFAELQVVMKSMGQRPSGERPLVYILPKFREGVGRQDKDFQEF